MYGFYSRPMYLVTRSRYNKIHGDLLSPLPWFLVVFLVGPYMPCLIYLIEHVYQLLAGSLCMDEHDMVLIKHYSLHMIYTIEKMLTIIVNDPLYRDSLCTHVDVGLLM